MSSYPWPDATSDGNGGEDQVVEEAITVNQRALIDKILARYAAEFTLLRELLQNADDAEAHTCRLLFSSNVKPSPRTQSLQKRIHPHPASLQPPPPSSSQQPESLPLSGSTSSTSPIDLSAQLYHWVFQNDGKPFTSDDWTRLRRIAEGNPDPQRIGAFGVGFYSLFSICQEPLVTSGDTAMGFFWKGDSLYTRRTTQPPWPGPDNNSSAKQDPKSASVVPEDEDANPTTSRPWTSFHMGLREPASLPETALALCEFLVTSLAFTSHVRAIEVYWDHTPLLLVNKSLSASREVGWNKKVLSCLSPDGMMQVQSLLSTPVRISAHVAWAVLQDEQKRRRANESILSSLARKVAYATGRGHSAAVPVAPTSGSGGGGGFFSSALGSVRKALGGGSGSVFGAASSPSPSESNTKGKKDQTQIDEETDSIPGAFTSSDDPKPIQTDGLSGSDSKASNDTRSAGKVTPRSTDMISSEVQFHAATANISTKLDRSFVRELERSTKKAPPVKTTLSMIYTAKGDKDKSLLLRTTSPTSTSSSTSSPATSPSSVPRASLPEGMEDIFSGLVPLLVSSQASSPGSTSALELVSGSGLNSSSNAHAGDGLKSSSARTRMGRIFIGFRTHQTTSFGGHVAARLIPTVERESLDFIDRYCAKWNMELLALGAFTARAVYEDEMIQLGQRWIRTLGPDARWGHAELAPVSEASKREKEDAGDAEEKESGSDEVHEKRQAARALLDEALHLMHFFTFGLSTPSGKVGEIISDRFFACSKWTSLSLLSTAGVETNKNVRWPNATLGKFVKRVPVIPPEHAEATGFLRTVKLRGMVQNILMNDMMAELSARPLDLDEMTACLTWWMSVSVHVDYMKQYSREFNSSAVVRTPASAGGPNGHPDREAIQPLSMIKYWRNLHRIPSALPVPPSCLPIQVSQALSTAEMERAMGWTELPVHVWVEYLITYSSSPSPSKPDLLCKPEFNQMVLTTLARAWSNLKAASAEAIVHLLQDVECIPTRSGSPNAQNFSRINTIDTKTTNNADRGESATSQVTYKRPADAYFSSVALFEDLPIACFSHPPIPVKGNLDKMLTALGVRKHVELQLIFDRLVSSGNWSHVDLISYLAENQNTLTAQEWAKLRKTPMLLTEEEDTHDSASSGGKKSLSTTSTPTDTAMNVGSTAEKKKLRRYLPEHLYEPTVSHRALHLPVLSWSGKPWRANSEEAKLLFNLGLKRHPKLETLLTLASGSEENVRKLALRYLLENFERTYSSDWKRHSKAGTLEKYAFVPCLSPQTGWENGNDYKKGTETGAGKMTCVLRPHTKAFISSGASVLGFAIVDHQSLQDIGGNASLLPALLSLPSHPEPRELIEQLVNKATTDHDMAQKRFEYLATVPDFNLNDFAFLSQQIFVPVTRHVGAMAKDVNQGRQEAGVVLAPPSQCFFARPSMTQHGSQAKAEEEVVPRELFQYCDFGPLAGAFLKHCGVSEHPSPEQVATKLVAEPGAFYTAVAGVEAYCSLLRRMEMSYKSFPPTLKKAMRTSPFLLAHRRVPVAVSSDTKSAHNTAHGQLQQPGAKDVDFEVDLDEDVEGTLVYDLRCAGDIVRVDQPSSMMLFASEIYAAPYDEVLSSFYEQLGSPRLSSLIHEQFHTLGSTQANTQLAHQIHSLILERTPLFLYEKAANVRPQVRGDLHYLKKRLEVFEVTGKGILLTRTLAFGRVHSQKVQHPSAWAVATSPPGTTSTESGSSWYGLSGIGGSSGNSRKQQHGQDSKITLLVASTLKLDWYEVAQQLCPFLLGTNNMEEILLYMSLLSTPLHDLRRRGFHVDKILAARQVQRQVAERKLREAKQQEELQRQEQERIEQEDLEKERLEQERLSQKQKDAQGNGSMLKPNLQHQNSTQTEEDRALLQSKSRPPVQPPQDTQERAQQQRPPSDSKSLDSHDGSDSLRGKGYDQNPSSGQGFFNQLRSRWSQNQSLSSLASGTSSIVRQSKRANGGSAIGSMGGAEDPEGATGKKKNAEAKEPLDPFGSGDDKDDFTRNIEQNVRGAIRASDGKGANASDHVTSSVPPSPPSRPVKPVQEADNYCDSHSGERLHVVGETLGVKVLCSAGVTAQDLLEGKYTAALHRFIQLIYRPVGAMFQVDHESLCVYVDTRPRNVVAFNLRGVIYFNLRVYLASHDTAVQRNQLTEALTSVYFTMAHELAHNLVTEHNARHEFYLSAIAKQFLPVLIRYLNRLNTQTQTQGQGNNLIQL